MNDAPRHSSTPAAAAAAAAARRLADRRRFRIAVQALALLAVGTFAWSLLWPEPNCSDPACARPRFSVFVELDALKVAGHVPLEGVADDRKVSVQSVLASGGVDATIVEDQMTLPYELASGKLDRADLHQLFQRWSSLAAPSTADAKIYAIVTTELSSDTGEDLFGIMFDYLDREGIAVAPSVTREKFMDQPAELIGLLQMRSLTHEILHSLNRYHLDAAQIADGRLTIEAPTKCISNPGATIWTLREKPLWALSPETIRYFQTAAAKDVLPGKSSAAFDMTRSSPQECAAARANRVPDPAYSRWALAIKRLKGLVMLSSARAENISDEPLQSADVTLQVQALPSPYPLGYPIAVRIVASNVGQQPIPLKGRLAPSFGFVHIETRRQPDGEWRALRPLAWYESADDQAAMLAPGEHTEQTVRIEYGEDGWTFPGAGTYEVRARLSLGDEKDGVTSPATIVRFEAPRTRRETAALEFLLDDSGELDHELGRLLAFDGRIGARDALDPIERLTSRFADTALGSAHRLTLASYKLRPALDADTGVRPKPDIAGALRLLSDACTDSGIAALKMQLLERHHEILEAADAVEPKAPGESAWDGTLADGSSGVATYADTELEQAGPAIHFCFDDAEIQDDARTAAERLARDLRRLKPQRVVIVGHTDYPGTCLANDWLALMRAMAMKKMLTGAGLKKTDIVAVTLGAKRPLDFSPTRAARALNRRVEILIPRNDLSRNERLARKAGTHAYPACPAPLIESPS